MIISQAMKFFRIPKPEPIRISQWFMSSVRVEVPRPVQLGSLKSENEGQVQFDMAGSWWLRDGDVVDGVLEGVKVQRFLKMGWIWVLKIAIHCSGARRNRILSSRCLL